MTDTSANLYGGAGSSVLSDAESLTMIEQLVGRAEMALLITLNKAAGAIYRDSQAHVPEAPEHNPGNRPAPYPEWSLADSATVTYATPEDPSIAVEYPGPYAAAQEAGEMVYESKTGKTVEWKAENYSVPGTGPRFLENAIKNVIPQLPEALGVEGRRVFGDIPGPVISAASAQEEGYTIERQALPTGDIKQVETVEQTKTDSFSGKLQIPEGEFGGGEE